MIDDYFDDIVVNVVLIFALVV